jgi:hypothetical protein
VIAGDLESLVALGREPGVKTQHSDPDILCALEVVIYGLEGMAAYAEHAFILGQESAPISLADNGGAAWGGEAENQDHRALLPGVKRGDHGAAVQGEKKRMCHLLRDAAAG